MKNFFPLLLLILIYPLAAFSEQKAVFMGNDWVVDSQETLTIFVDKGGKISLYTDMIDQIEIKNKKVRILGTCISSCAMFLGTKDVCVAPYATIGFHSPTTKSTDPDRIPQLRNTIASYYPDELKIPFLLNWGQKAKVTWFLGSEIAQMVPSIELCV